VLSYLLNRNNLKIDIHRSYLSKA